MGALNLKTIDLVFDDYKTIDSQSMVHYFEKLKSVYPESPKIHLIIDQGPYNISLKTKEAAKQYGIVLHHLPPYSPNLNPIERLWKVMNENVRNKQVFESAKVFIKSIREFFEITFPKIASSMTSRINDNFQILIFIQIGYIIVFKFTVPIRFIRVLKAVVAINLSDPFLIQP